MQRRNLTLTVGIFLLILTTQSFAQAYVRARAKSGDGIYAMLRRYQLPTDSFYLKEFKKLNDSRLGASERLRIGSLYSLPIRRYEYNGRSIRTTLGHNDYNWAKKIQNFNESLQQAGLRSQHYMEDRDLWVPLHLLAPVDDRIEAPASSPKSQPSDLPTYTFSIFGENYKTITRLDNSLQGYYFYLVSGHGGPDPGAVGARHGHQLCEDEYAYDITLRLARKLIEHGAVVYVIVRDPNDGIRDDQILHQDWDEYYFGGSRISSRTRTRLQKRADIINRYYMQNRGKAKEQYTIILHVDSRIERQRIDIFYLYQAHNIESLRLARQLYYSVKEKYAAVQPGRGYRSRISKRDLFMLRHTQPATVYIELGNIQNQRDQNRFVIANNRQAVANWLGLGVQNFIQER